MTNRQNLLSVWCCMVANLVIAFLAYEVCRLAFIAENWHTFADNLTAKVFFDIHSGAWRFDLSAVLYTNALYILMMAVPLLQKETTAWQCTARWIWLVCNGLCMIANLADCVYFAYTGRRTTGTVFKEFSNEGNLTDIFGVELLRHWYLVVLFLAWVWLMWRMYQQPKRQYKPKRKTTYFLSNTLALVVTVPLCIGGMRGGFTTAVRPITISNANQYVDSPQLAAIVLNTPFSLIRTFDKVAFEEVDFMQDEEAERLYSPLHQKGDKLSADTALLHGKGKGKNVVLLIVESFGREYIGGYNKWLDDGKYRGYTPFLDSLMQHSLTFEYSYCNGRKSIDGMPSVISSIPMFVEPFFLTPMVMNDVSGLAKELKSEGYYSAFFHGAENGSMGFQAFARATGFNDYFGRTEFNRDKRFRGNEEFDGVWAVWDEPFLQYFALQMNDFRQPFVSTVFTASSHHPFAIPDEYKEIFPEEGIKIHKCVRYTDNALRKFFETAQTQPWYNNTIFVLTSDHTGTSDHGYYQTDLGKFASPIMFFDPTGELKSGMRNAIAQQIDIMPTLLGYLGYDKPFVAFGKDLFYTADEDTWAVNYLNGIYQFVRGDYLLQFDGKETTAVYRFRTDLLLKNNLKGKVAEQDMMERQLKSIIQQYMDRMVNNELVVRP